MRCSSGFVRIGGADRRNWSRLDFSAGCEFASQGLSVIINSWLQVTFGGRLAGQVQVWWGLSIAFSEFRIWTHSGIHSPLRTIALLLLFACAEISQGVRTAREIADDSMSHPIPITPMRHDDPVYYIGLCRTSRTCCAPRQREKAELFRPAKNTPQLTVRPGKYRHGIQSINRINRTEMGP